MDTHTLIWLFPIAFMFHDFEEIILFEPWLEKNVSAIKDHIKHVPVFLSKRIEAGLTISANRSTSGWAFSVSLIFGLTVIASFLAVEFKEYTFFLLASGVFFLHGFAHLGQAIALRRYVPAVISSVLFVIPYGAALYWRLLTERIVDMSGLLIYFLFAAVLIVPFILVTLQVGDYLYGKIARLV